MIARDTGMDCQRSCFDDSRSEAIMSGRLCHPQPEPGDLHIPPFFPVVALILPFLIVTYTIDDKN